MFQQKFDSNVPFFLYRCERLHVEVLSENGTRAWQYGQFQQGVYPEKKYLLLRCSRFTSCYPNNIQTLYIVKILVNPFVEGLRLLYISHLQLNPAYSFKVFDPFSLDKNPRGLYCFKKTTRGDIKPDPFFISQTNSRNCETLLRGAINPDELTQKLCLRRDGCMDSMGLNCEVWIKSTDDDAGMVAIGIVLVYNFAILKQPRSLGIAAQFPPCVNDSTPRHLPSPQPAVWDSIAISRLRWYPVS
jgi:hypothetical protein